MITKVREEEFLTLDSMFNDFIIEEAIYDVNFNKNFKFKSLKEGIDDSNIILLYKENEKIIGFIYGTIIDSKININKILKINFLYVIKEYRKKGVATELINKLGDIAKEENIKYIEVQVYSNNLKACNLYLKSKFNNFTTTLRKEI